LAERVFGPPLHTAPRNRFIGATAGRRSSRCPTSWSRGLPVKATAMCDNSEHRVSRTRYDISYERKGGRRSFRACSFAAARPCGRCSSRPPSTVSAALAWFSISHQSPAGINARWNSGPRRECLRTNTTQSSSPTERSSGSGTACSPGPTASCSSTSPGGRVAETQIVPPHWLNGLTATTSKLHGVNPKPLPQMYVPGAYIG